METRVASLSDTERPTAEKVAAWFPHSVFGKPTPEDCAELAKKINHVADVRKRRTAKSISNSDDGYEHLAEAVKLARSLKNELDAHVKLNDSKELVLLNHLGEIIWPKDQEARSLLTALDQFLNLNPGRKIGAPPKWWHELAEKWARDVAAVFPKRGGRSPSLTSDTGPVLAVVHQILNYCYGCLVDQAIIGRALRVRKAKRKSCGISA